MKFHGKEWKNKKAVLQITGLKNVWSGFSEYIKGHPVLGIVTAAVLALCYAGQAFSTQFYIDAEVILNFPGAMYNWNEIGRFGLVWLKKMSGLDWYNPYLAGGLFLITLWLTAMGTGYLFARIDQRLSSVAAGIFMLLYLVYPTYSEQFMFRFQAFEVVFAMFLLAVADWYFIQFLKEKNWASFVVSIVLLVFSFGIYQSMVNMQLCLYFGMFLFCLIAEKEDGKCVKRQIIFTILHFAAAFVVYELIIKLFYSQSDYLSGQISWQYEGVGFVAHKILNYIGEVFAGGQVFYTASYKVGICLLLLTLIGIVIVKKGRSVWYVLGGIALAASPFYLSVITGAETVYRAQLMLPLACALMWLFCIHCLSVLFSFAGRQLLAQAGILVGAVLLFQQAGPLMRLFYTQDVIGRSDLMTATQMVEDIYEVTSVFGGKPVIFIGHRAPLQNGSCYTYEEAPTYLCRSAFELDYMAEPMFYYSTHRILGYFQTMGYYFARPTTEMIPQACEDSIDMVCWPIEGSVKEFEDYVIVKLSN